MTKPDDIPEDIRKQARRIYFNRCDEVSRLAAEFEEEEVVDLLVRAITAEREACAEACLGRPFGKIFAAAIRNREATTPGSMQAEADPGGLVERNGRQ